jgi:prepilin-type N-terminal cleavage/methylation domain-containing protein
MTSRQKLAQAGFTLVELAIVLLIVGLLISGILKGQELIENSRTTATIQQVKSYEAAVNTFRDSFGGLPGDIRTADSRVPGCATGNAISCANGDGNGRIGAVDGALTAMPATVAGEERAGFWQHLALANLVTGIVPDFTTNTQSAWGSTLPSSRLSGGFAVGQANQVAGAAGNAGPISGHYLVVLSAPTVAANIATNAALRPARAAQIDLKLDDGQPGTGDVVAVGNGTTCASANTTLGVYQGGTQTAACNLAIRIIN